MGREALPTEEEQFEAYKAVLERMEDKPVVVRTLDIGGDKELSIFESSDRNESIFRLSCNSLMFRTQDIFRTQLRALLRASILRKLENYVPDDCNT